MNLDLDLDLSDSAQKLLLSSGSTFGSYQHGMNVS